MEIDLDNVKTIKIEYVKNLKHIVSDTFKLNGYYSDVNYNVDNNKLVINHKGLITIAYKKVDDVLVVYEVGNVYNADIYDEGNARYDIQEKAYSYRNENIRKKLHDFVDTWTTEIKEKEKLYNDMTTTTTLSLESIKYVQIMKKQSVNNYRQPYLDDYYKQIIIFVEERDNEKYLQVVGRDKPKYVVSIDGDTLHVEVLKVVATDDSDKDTPDNNEYSVKDIKYIDVKYVNELSLPKQHVQVPV